MKPKNINKKRIDQYIHQSLLIYIKAFTKALYPKTNRKTTTNQHTIHTMFK